MGVWPFDTVLIANRGEIAVRIIRSVHAMGLRSVAVFSDADAQAPHVLAADRAVRLGPAPAAESYLCAQAIIEAARASGAGAVHPGYGFLSENAAFSEACRQAGLVFVGPGAEAIHAMGNKRQAKERMQAAGVPCIPGYLGAGQETERFLETAAKIGYPVMVKAAAGGGGRGMRLVTSPEMLEAALRAAASEARNAFGDGTLYMEKALRGARHVEVQIIADAHGTVLHLGERDCSIQRRHQKVVEESPSPAVDERLRARMTADAVAAARAIGYCNAGTVEFLLDPEGRYYFLEMNTRLQVEHPVTECVTGLDLVELQLRVAAGEPLRVRQDDIRFAGHAMEVRLCAEDPDNGFLPCTGKLLDWVPASGPGLRTDAGISTGQTISPHYDSMLAKIVAHGRDREDARRRLVRAIEQTIVAGVTTNQQFLARVLRHPGFASGTAATDFLPRADLAAPPPPRELRAAAALLLAWPDWMSLDDWRRAGPGRWLVRLAGGALRVERDRSGDVCVRAPGEDGAVIVTPFAKSAERLDLRLGPIVERVRFYRWRDGVEVHGFGAAGHFAESLPNLSRGVCSSRLETLTAPISGRVIRVGAAVGDAVAVNTCIVVVEAMKMECEIRNNRAGVIDSLGVEVGAQVSLRQVLAVVKPPEPEVAP